MSRPQTRAPSSRDPQVSLLDKWRCLATAMAPIRMGALKASDFLVLFYILDSIDRRDGDAQRLHRTIAFETGLSRETVKRAIRRLVEAEILVVEPQFLRGSKERRANRYRIAPDLLPKRPPRRTSGPRGRVTEGPVSSHYKNIPSSDSPGHKPAARLDGLGDPAEPTDAEPSGTHDDLEEVKRYLHLRGQYDERHGSFSYRLASDDIEELRASVGRAGVMRCIEEAKRRGLFGRMLEEHVQSRARWR